MHFKSFAKPKGTRMQGKVAEGGVYLETQSKTVKFLSAKGVLWYKRKHPGHNHRSECENI